MRLLGLYTVEEEGTAVLAGAALGVVTSGERLLSTGEVVTTTVEAIAVAVPAGMQIPQAVMGVGMVPVLLVHGTNIPFILKSVRYNFDRDDIFTTVVFRSCLDRPLLDGFVIGVGYRIVILTTKG